MSIAEAVLELVWMGFCSASTELTFVLQLHVGTGKRRFIEERVLVLSVEVVRM
jgi:hypothetical protein